MNQDEDQILQRELAKLGALGGFVGGFVPGAIGGYLGAKFSAKFLPTETFSETLEVQAPAAEALDLCYRLFEKLGRITADAAEPSQLPQLCAIVGSGALQMNPTILAVTVNPISETASAIVITGAAKEGLIKQHSAKKAVMRFHESIQASLKGM